MKFSATVFASDLIHVPFGAAQSIFCEADDLLDEWNIICPERVGNYTLISDNIWNMGPNESHISMGPIDFFSKIRYRYATFHYQNVDGKNGFELMVGKQDEEGIWKEVFGLNPETGDLQLMQWETEEEAFEENNLQQTDYKGAHIFTVMQQSFREDTGERFSDAMAVWLDTSRGLCFRLCWEGTISEEASDGTEYHRKETEMSRSELLSLVRMMNDNL